MTESLPSLVAKMIQPIADIIYGTVKRSAVEVDQKAEFFWSPQGRAAVLHSTIIYNLAAELSNKPGADVVSLGQLKVLRLPGIAIRFNQLNGEMSRCVNRTRQTALFAEQGMFGETHHVTVAYEVTGDAVARVALAYESPSEPGKFQWMLDFVERPVSSVSPMASGEGVGYQVRIDVAGEAEAG